MDIGSLFILGPPILIAYGLSKVKPPRDPGPKIKKYDLEDLEDPKYEKSLNDLYKVSNSKISRRFRNNYRSKNYTRNKYDR